MLTATATARARHVLLLLVLLGGAGEAAAKERTEIYNEDGTKWEPTDGEDPNPPTIKMKAPVLSEAEQSPSNAIPDEHICDACVGTAWGLSKALKRKEELFTAGEKLSEVLVFETLEEACVEATKGYGIKALFDTHHIRVLSGQGLPALEEAGAQMGGGTWDIRLQKACLNAVEELGEMEIYDAYIANIGEENPLKEFFCRNEEATFRDCKTGRKETTKEVLSALKQVAEQYKAEEKAKKAAQKKHKKKKGGKKKGKGKKKGGKKKGKKAAKKAAKKEAKKAKKAAKKAKKAAKKAAKKEETKVTWDE